jgi:hypothetical protein
MNRNYFLGIFFSAILIGCGSACAQTGEVGTRLPATQASDFPQSDEPQNPESLEIQDRQRAFLRDFLTNGYKFLQQRPMEGRDRVTAGFSAKMGFAVPSPGPDGPVDYVAWILSLTETENNVAAAYFDAAKDHLKPWTGDPDLIECALENDAQALLSPELNCWLADNEEAIKNFLSAGLFEYHGNLTCKERPEHSIYVKASTGPLSSEIRDILWIKVNLVALHGDVTGALELLCDVAASGGRFSGSPAAIEHLICCATHCQACWKILNAFPKSTASGRGPEEV